MGVGENDGPEHLNVETPATDRMQKPFMRRLRDDIDDLYFEEKITVNGCSMITHLTSMYWGCRGFPENLQDIALLPLIQKLGIDSSRGTVLISLIFAPWAMKPFFALLSDLVPFLFFKKRWYMVLVSCLGAYGAFMASPLGSTPDELRGDVPPDQQGFLLFVYFALINGAIAMCDSLSQGKYTEICKWKGATVVSYVSGSKILAGVAAALVGPRFNDSDPQINMMIIIPFFAQGAVVFGMNFMGDRKLPMVCGFDSAIWNKDKRIIITGLTLGGIAAMLLVFELLTSNGIVTITSRMRLGFATAGIVAVLGMTFWSLPRAVAAINVYIIFCRVAALDVRFVLQQWYTSRAAQCGAGNTPHFPNTIYQMVGLILGNVMTLFGIWLFENYVYFWNAQKSFWVTTVFTVVAALFDVSMITQFNRTLWSWLPFMSNKVTWLCGDDGCDPGGYRLDDMFGFLIGMQALKPIATTLDDMPSTVLLSKLCPAGVETTVFAILAALMNLGLTVSGLLAGEFFTKYEVKISSNTKFETLEGKADHFEICTFGVPSFPAGGEACVCGVSDGKNYCEQFICNFGNSPLGDSVNGITWTLIVGGMLLPLTTIPATFCLIPNKPLNEDMVDEQAPAEVDLAGGVAPHPAIAFARDSPSYLDLGGATANKEELEKASIAILGSRSGSGLLAGSRAM